MTRVLTLDLPWPPSELIPHARGNWRKKARVTKAYRKTCGEEAQAQGVRRIPASKIDALVQFFPPDRRRRDKQNIEASFKAGIDGIADVIGIDDFEWNIRWQHGEPRAGGAVRVEIEVS